MIDIIEKHFESVYELYKKIVLISSESHDKEGVDRVCSAVYEFALSHGFKAEITENEKAGNELILTFNYESKEKPVVFLAHMDTVHKKGTFEKMFEEKDGKINGPGVLDCKGGIAVSLLTVMALKDYGYLKPLRIVLVCDEEISMVLSGEKGRNFIIDNVKDASFVFTCESGTKDKIVVGRKGVTRYKVTVCGKSAHAGSDYDKGISAIRAACLMIPELEKLSDINGITYNCGVIQGGKAPNIVPDLCEFIVDVRYLNNEQMEKSEKTLKKILNSVLSDGISIKIDMISRREAMEPTEQNLKLFKRVKSISEKLGYEKFTSIVPGGASDAAYSSLLGIPTLCGMGMTGKSQHTLNETADKLSLKERSHILADTVISLYEEGL